MSSTPSPQPAHWVPITAALLAALHASTFLAAGPVDDDYIVHRYAANLLAGHGFVFNPDGEVAEGFTSPLWLFISALIQLLSLPLEPTVRALGVACSAATAYTIAYTTAYTIARTAQPSGDRWSGAWAGVAVAASPALAFHAVAGLGTLPMALSLALFASHWLRADKAGRTPWTAGAWLAVACLARQEAAVFWLPFVAVLFRRGALLAALPAALALAGWTALRLAAFGRLDPITHAVKRLPWAAELHYGSSYLWHSTLDALAGVVLLVALLTVADRRAAPTLRALAAGVALHGFFVVSVGGDWMPLARFFVPVLPLGILLVVRFVQLRLPARVRPVALSLTLLALLAGGLRERPQVLFDHGFFERRWLALGDAFKELAPAGARVALSPIGAFGYRSGLTIVDLLGLTHTGLLGVAPDLTGVRMKGHHRYDADAVLADPPEFMLLGNGVLQPDSGRLDINPWERTLVLDPRFRAQYLHVRGVVDGEPCEWFRRRDVAPFPGETTR